MTREEAVALLERYSNYDGMGIPNLAGCKEAMKVAADALKEVYPELAESEGERIRKRLIEYFEGFRIGNAKVKWEGLTVQDVLAWLEKQKENPKSADSISSDCMLDAKCENRWYKVTDSLPDNGRLVLAKDCLGNVLLARYDGENWEVNVYDNEDHYCHNSISKWCEIPSEKQKEQKPWKVGANAYFTPEQKPADLSEMMVHKEPYIAPVPTPMVADEQKPSLCDECKKKSTCLDTKYGDDRVVEQCINFVKMKQKPVEWSEEDENKLNHILEIVHIASGSEASVDEKEELESFLKSLRPSWKPSKEQMKYLLMLADYFESEGGTSNAKTLREFHEQLKKLM